jgi:hypothetical protein
MGNEIDFGHALAALRAQFPEYRIEYDCTEDPEWRLYAEWLAADTLD